jgi:ribosomal protein S18 acetylase RimI-like enzyme
MLNQEILNVSLQEAKPGESIQLNAMANEIWMAHYPKIIGLVQVNYMLEKMYNLETLEQHLSNGPQVFHWVQNFQQNVGFIAVEQRSEVELYLQKFYILPPMQGTGVGHKAFEQLATAYPQSQSIKLQVNRQNYTAINFYFKLGFKIECVADFDIGDGYFMNDFVMVWHRR